MYLNPWTQKENPSFPFPKGKLFEKWFPNRKITSTSEVSFMNPQAGASVGSCLAFSSWNKKSISRMKGKINMMKCLCGERRKLPISSFPTRLCAQGSYNRFYKGAWDRFHAGICECYWGSTRESSGDKGDSTGSYFGNPALHHDPLVLLLQCAPTEVVINSGELHCLSENTNSHISLPTSTKALGGLFYGYGSGKVNIILFCFLALGD